MGSQQSFVQFKDLKTLRKELKKYQKTKRSYELNDADIICISRVTKNISPFRKGELVAVVGGERGVQREIGSLGKGLGVENIIDIVFADNFTYWDMANMEGLDLGEFLNQYFETLSDMEYEELLK